MHELPALHHAEIRALVFGAQIIIEFERRFLRHISITAFLDYRRVRFQLTEIDTSQRGLKKCASRGGLRRCVENAPYGSARTLRVGFSAFAGCNRVYWDKMTLLVVRIAGFEVRQTSC
jgi:hypothetical protein